MTVFNIIRNLFFFVQMDDITGSIKPNMYPKFSAMFISVKYGVFWKLSGGIYREVAEVCSTRAYSLLAHLKLLKCNLSKKTSNLRFQAW